MKVWRLAGALNPQPPDYQSDMHPTELLSPAAYHVTRKMPNGIMEGFFSTVLEQATYSGRNKRILPLKVICCHEEYYNNEEYSQTCHKGHLH